MIDPRIQYADTRKHMTTQKALRTQIKKKFQTTRQPLLKFPTEITQPTLVAQAYADAKQLEPSFRFDIQRVASELGVQGQCRPNTGIKSAERILEKNKKLSGTSPLGLPRLRRAKRSILNGNNPKIYVASNGELHPQRLTVSSQ
jgi:hypothetical protein